MASKNYYNEYDENQVDKVLVNNKRKRRRRRLRILSFFLVIALIIVYFVTPASRVKTITVKGNEVVSNEAIEQASNLDDNVIYLFMSKSKTADKVRELPLIKEASVSVNLFGYVTIEIEEANQVAYCILDNKTYVVDEEGEVVETTDSVVIDKLKSSPQLSSFKDLDFLEEFAKEYVKIPDLIKNQTSDIIYSPKNSDDSRLIFVLDSGKQLIVRLEDMADELSRFPYEAYMSEKSNVCTFDFYGDTIYMDNCEE